MDMQTVGYRFFPAAAAVVNEGAPDRKDFLRCRPRTVAPDACDLSSEGPFLVKRPWSELLEDFVVEPSALDQLCDVLSARDWTSGFRIPILGHSRSPGL